MSKELFSIILPCYNAKKYIEESVNSVIRQTYQNWELIIVDDCSTDSTLEVINSFTDSRISILRNLTNQGVAMSRNKGIKKAKGNFISFLDADDIWLEHKLMMQLSYLQRGYLVCCSNYVIIDENGIFIKEVLGHKEFGFISMLASNLIANSSAIYNVDILGKQYQLNIGHEDYLMWLTLFKQNKNLVAFRVQESLMLYRVHSKSLSHSKIAAAFWTWRIFYRELNLGFPRSCFSFILYALKGVSKQYLK